jgi:hypothetical protein
MQNDQSIEIKFDNYKLNIANSFRRKIGIEFYELRYRQINEIKNN